MNKTHLYKVFAALSLLVASPWALADTTYACAANAGVNCSNTIPDYPIVANFSSSLTVPASANTVCGGGRFISAGVQLKLVHDRVGDLLITATGPNGAVTLLNRPNGDATTTFCAGEDINAIFSNAGGPANACRNALIPAVGGVQQPVSGAAALANASVAGNWTLSVTDQSNGMEGLVEDWGVVVQCETPNVPTQSSAGLLLMGLLLAMAGVLAVRRRYL
jgi:subtilisin-like proprotein convertase family protein